MGVEYDGGPGAPGLVLPAPLPSVGKDGWGHYWHPARISGGPGDVATSWPDAPNVNVPADNLLPVATDNTAPLPDSMTKDQGKMAIFEHASASSAHGLSRSAATL